MKKIAAGIVLYNPDLVRLEENIDAIINQVDALILIDNNSDNINEVKKLYCKSKIYIIENEKNRGIAAALNQIVEFCYQSNYEWVVTLDQDSVSPPNLVEKYKSYLGIDSRIGIMTPNVVDRNFREEESTKMETIEFNCEYVEKCITSASFINISICNEIGCFDEKMFIDLVDFEYCTRLRKAEYKILKITDVTLLHELGRLKVYTILGKDIRVTNHSILRYYYYSRNTIYFSNKHSDSFNKKQASINIFKKIFKILFFEDEKNKKVKAIISGVKDGRKMIM